MYMGLAFADLNWSPDQFWHSTVRELMTAYAFAIPETEVNSGKHVPFNAEEKAILKEMWKKADRERNLKHGK